MSNIRQIAEQDLATTLEDETSGFGVRVSLTSPPPESKTEELVGQTKNVGVQLDPDTGQLVEGQSFAVVLRISSILSAGFAELPRAINLSTGKPWKVEMPDNFGTITTYKVASTMDDKTLGVIVLILGGLK